MLVYRADANPAVDIPFMVIYASGARPGHSAPPPLYFDPADSLALDAAREAGWPSSTSVYAGLDEEARLLLWAERLVQALSRRGFPGIPQGYYVRPAPLIARYKFRHREIVPHPTPRRGPANRVRG